MQVYKYLKAIILVFVLLITNLLYSQSRTDMPTSPTINMPDMPELPTISIPALGDGFYTPSIQNNQPKKSAINEFQKNDQTIITSTQANSDQILQTLLNTNSLTADDISTLYDTGLFNNISSLNNINLTQNSNNTALLEQILITLNSMKLENSNTSQTKEVQTIQSDKNSFQQRIPSILRFRVNNYDITPSLTKSFFSKTEADGTFLLTADRKYFLNNRPRTETFYVLFKAVKDSNNSKINYIVTPSIIQDSKNENSLVYKFSQQKNLTAQKIGNLVVLKDSNDNLVIDMLLDIDTN